MGENPMQGRSAERAFLEQNLYPLPCICLVFNVAPEKGLRAVKASEVSQIAF